MADDILERLRNRYPDVVHPHLLTDAELIGAAFVEIERLQDEMQRLRATVRKAARDLYVAEVQRQGVGWDDYCTELLVRAQHDLAAETKP